MSAEDELVPRYRWPPVDAAAVAMLAEFWDDTESDWRNMELIGFWLKLQPGAGERRHDPR